jgi:transposase
MDDQSDAPQTPRRIEILTGAGGRRIWSSDLKAKIVIESYQPGVMVTELARRYGARASQIHKWRKDGRAAGLAPRVKPATGFAQVVVAAERTPSQTAPPPKASASIEIEAEMISVRVRAGADPALVGAIIRALKASS